MTTVSPILQVAHLGKTYPPRLGRTPFEAVRDVSFDVHGGEILGLLGPNGAGKSSTLKMIAGLVRPTTGAITIGGVDVAAHRSRAVRKLGAVLEGNRNLHWKLTTEENMAYFGALKGARDVNGRIATLVMRFELEPHRKKCVGELSRGLQQRVAIAVALMVAPDVLLLDEPTLGLDVLSASTFQDVVRGIAADGCAIVLTTHQMEVAQALSQRIAIIAGGRLAALDSLDALKAAYRAPGYVITVRGEVEGESRHELGCIGVVAGDEPPAGLATWIVPEGASDGLYAALAILRSTGLELVKVEQREVNLEAIYRRIVGGLVTA